jgi:hypothetical protein
LELRREKLNIEKLKKFNIKKSDIQVLIKNGTLTIDDDENNNENLNNNNLNNENLNNENLNNKNSNIIENTNNNNNNNNLNNNSKKIILNYNDFLGDEILKESSLILPNISKNLIEKFNLNKYKNIIYEIKHSDEKIYFNNLNNKNFKIYYLHIYKKIKFDNNENNENNENNNNNYIENEVKLKFIEN